MNHDRLPLLERVPQHSIYLNNSPLNDPSLAALHAQCPAHCRGGRGFRSAYCEFYLPWPPVNHPSGFIMGPFKSLSWVHSSPALKSEEINLVSTFPSLLCCHPPTLPCSAVIHLPFLALLSSTFPSLLCCHPPDDRWRGGGAPGGLFRRCGAQDIDRHARCVRSVGLHGSRFMMR